MALYLQYKEEDILNILIYCVSKLKSVILDQIIIIIKGSQSLSCGYCIN